MCSNPERLSQRTKSSLSHFKSKHDLKHPPRRALCSRKRRTKTKKAATIKLLPLMGLGRLGLPTSRLSGVRSNRLSYKPMKTRERNFAKVRMTTKSVSDEHRNCDPLKEVIQPQVPLRLPCYDFIPITTHTLGDSVLCRFGHRLRVQTAFMM